MDSLFNFIKQNNKRGVPRQLIADFVASNPILVSGLI
jgi:hypothetical protein